MPLEPAGSATVQRYGHPNELPPDAQRLFAECGQHHLESSLEWYRNLVQVVYTGDSGVLIYVALKNGHAVAALPVRVVYGTGRTHLESLSNYYTALYGPLLSSTATHQDLAAILRTIQRDFPSLSSLQFSPLDPQTPGFAMLQQALQDCGLRTFAYFCFGNWYLPVTSDWPAYLQNRQGAVRSTLNRIGKKFTAAGGTLELLHALPDVNRGAAAFQKVYAASWKPPEPYANFVPALMRTCARNGWLRLGVAWLHGQPVAAQLWIVANGKAHIYKLAYDEAFKPFAPGTLLTAMLMEHVLTQDAVQEVDYLIGDDPYKQQWMSHRRERWGLVAYNTTTVAGLLGWMKERVIRLLKPRPGLEIIQAENHLSQGKPS